MLVRLFAAALVLSTAYVAETPPRRTRRRPDALNRVLGPTVAPRQMPKSHLDLRQEPQQQNKAHSSTAKRLAPPDKEPAEAKVVTTTLPPTTTPKPRIRTATGCYCKDSWTYDGQRLMGCAFSLKGYFCAVDNDCDAASGSWVSPTGERTMWDWCAGQKIKAVHELETNRVPFFTYNGCRCKLDWETNGEQVEYCKIPNAGGRPWCYVDETDGRCPTAAIGAAGQAYDYCFRDVLAQQGFEPLKVKRTIHGCHCAPYWTVDATAYTGCAKVADEYGCAVIEDETLCQSAELKYNRRWERCEMNASTSELRVLLTSYLGHDVSAFEHRGLGAFLNTISFWSIAFIAVAAALFALMIKACFAVGARSREAEERKFKDALKDGELGADALLADEPVHHKKVHHLGLTGSRADQHNVSPRHSDGSGTHSRSHKHGDSAAHGSARHGDSGAHGSGQHGEHAVQ
mmetsp:Transcript_11229/g.26820  ORF Transcript_11229/g.26820 Transcript_11229/m.26820 type:complete len:458 (-) Transcript_11229:34-1407(-)